MNIQIWAILVERLSLMSGLVFVWDLDNTLVGNYFDVTDSQSQERLHFNQNALLVLSKAIQARSTGIVDAILLLTNNADKDFIVYVVRTLENMFRTPHIFDYIMDRNEPSRPQGDNPPKRLEDIEYMLRLLNKSIYRLASRVFFFDDIPDHELRSELPPTHYIQIEPAFHINTVDRTNFKPVMDAISARGGRRVKKGGGHSRGRTRKTMLRRKKLMKKNLTNMDEDL